MWGYTGVPPQHETDPCRCPNRVPGDEYTIVVQRLQENIITNQSEPKYNLTTLVQRHCNARVTVKLNKQHPEPLTNDIQARNEKSSACN